MTKITKEQVAAAEDIIKRKKDEERVEYDAAQKIRMKKYEGTFWRGPTTAYADKDGIHIMKALRSDGCGRTIFEVWTYAHDGVYSIEQQRSYGLNHDMKQITELEFYIEARRFLFKIKAFMAIEE